MIGLTPDQGAFILKAAWLLVELSSCAVALWLYSHRYAIRSRLSSIRRFL